MLGWTAHSPFADFSQRAFWVDGMEDGDMMVMVLREGAIRSSCKGVVMFSCKVKVDLLSHDPVLPVANQTYQ